MRKRVLVVEDDPSCELQLTRLILSVYPEADIVCEDSAEQALDLVEEEQAKGWNYDLIIADIFLSGKATGLDFWQACRDYMPNTPIVVTSSLPLVQFFSAVGKDNIAPNYLMKPLILGECRRIIENLMI